MRCSLWQHRNTPKRVERRRTSVVGVGRVDVVLEGKRDGCDSPTRGDRPLSIRTQQRSGVKRATAG